MTSTGADPVAVTARDEPGPGAAEDRRNMLAREAESDRAAQDGRGDREPASPSLPRITTIIPTWNAAATIERAIQSHWAQRYPNKELIVVDGGSTDGTQDLLARLGDAITFWRSEPDAGLFDAWNKALGHSTGDWLHFLGADDWYYDPEVFSAVGPILQASRSLVVYGQAARVDRAGRVVDILGGRWQPKHFRQVGMSICHQGVFQHRALFTSYGVFPPDYPLCPQYEFLLRYLKDHDAHHAPELIVAYCQVTGMSNHPKNHLAYHRSYRRAQKLHGTNRLSAVLVWKYAVVLVKWLLWWLLPRAVFWRTIDLGRRLQRKPAMYGGIWLGPKPSPIDPQKPSR